MAHKNLKGVKSARKSTLKKQFKKDKEKKRLKAQQKAKKEADPNRNPYEGLRKWQIKALKAEAAEAEAQKRKKGGNSEAQAVVPTEAPPVSAVQKAPVVDSTTSPSVSQKEKKLAKKEARIQAAQLRGHRQLYDVKGPHRLLLVGEGNFSFACALCEVRGSGEGLYATSFDGEATLKRKYPDALELRKKVEDMGGTSLLNVDATKLHKVREFRDAFRIIAWNFPHLGAGEKDVEKNNEQHRKLLSEFFASAYRCLDQQGVVHVAMKHGEPYKSWKIVQLAKAATDGALQLQGVVPFSLSAWPGYAHRRTRGFHERFSKKDSEELAKGAKVYVFGRSLGNEEEVEDED